MRRTFGLLLIIVVATGLIVPIVAAQTSEPSPILLMAVRSLSGPGPTSDGDTLAIVASLDGPADAARVANSDWMFLTAAGAPGWNRIEIPAPAIGISPSAWVLIKERDSQLTEYAVVLVFGHQETAILLKAEVAMGDEQIGLATLTRIGEEIQANIDAAPQPPITSPELRAVLPWGDDDDLPLRFRTSTWVEENDQPTAQLSLSRKLSERQGVGSPIDFGTPIASPALNS